MTDGVLECPCRPVCAGLGLETGQWCRYHTSDLPPPGMRKFDPKETWCPSGVQANVLMLGYMLAGRKEDSETLRPALDSVRRWLRELRSQPTTSYPRGQAAVQSEGD